jgi:hypothetical protein
MLVGTYNMGGQCRLPTGSSDPGQIAFKKKSGPPRKYRNICQTVCLSAKLAAIGGWLEQIGSVTDSSRLITLGILSSVIMPSESIWRRASYVMQTSIARTLDFSPFATRSAPNINMMFYAFIYLLFALGGALYRFHQRDL